MSMANFHSPEPPIVIVGAGHSGAKAAAALRKHGWRGGIVLIGDESHAPYDRPPLSKSVLLGKKNADQCSFFPPQWYQDNAIQLVLQAQVVSIHRGKAEVVLDDGQRMVYHRLLLATGARPRMLTIPGSDLGGVWPLRTPDHAGEIAKALLPQSKVVVIGAGVIGLEVAAAAAELGCHVVVLEAADLAMGRSLPEPASTALVSEHRARGVDVLLNAQVAHLEGGTHVRQVHLQTGGVIDCDVVVHGLGVQPNTELARGAGLLIDDGVRTDMFLRTSDERVFACGDVCCYDSGLYERPVRMENWRNAEDQADVVARNILGENQPFDAIPWFWSNQFNLSLQMAGLHTPGDEVEVKYVGTSMLFHSLDRNGAVRAVCGLGTAKDLALPIRQARESIRSQIMTSRAVLVG